MCKKLLSLCLLALTALPLSAQIDKTIDKIKEKADKVIDKGSDLLERGKDYVEDKADKVITRYGLDTLSVESVDSMMAVRYQKKGTYDEDYMERPSQRFTVKVRSSLSGSGIRANGTWNDTPLQGRLSSNARFTTNVGFSYRGIGLSIAVNPFKWKGNKRDTELRFELLNNRYGFDVSYQNAKTYGGSVDYVGKYDISSSYVTSKMFMVNGYYAFNYRRFSYPAAFTQSYRQLKSAGSWLVGASFLIGNAEIRGATAGIENNEIQHPPMKMKVGYLGIGGGYAYNWVVNEHLMFHGSLLPTLVIGSFSSMTVDAERYKIPYSFPQFLLTERVSALYEINDQHFINLAVVAHNTLLGGHRDMRMNYYKWRLTLSYGFRF